MSDQTEHTENQDRDEQTMARLLKLAGARVPVAKDIEARVYKKVFDEWRASTSQPDSARVYRTVQRAWMRSQRLSIALPLAIAASILLAVAIFVQPQSEPTSVPAIGTVVKLSGESRPGGLPALNTSLYPGDTVITGPGEGLSLLLVDTESVRIDENTALQVGDDNRFSLVSGRVYADTGDSIYRNRRLVIATPVGDVTDIGTQFSVAADGQALEIAVREGRVDLTRQDGLVTAVAGELVRLQGSSQPSIERLEPHDAFWDWASSLAPYYELDNRSLLDFLRWAARETGRELVFDDQELRLAAMRTDLHGSVSDFEPLEALESILATTSFKYRIEADKIIIRR
ncbi:MAG: FecR family protein [Woeseiaceae bacterium]|nr:FecR family protein [Woeseiaceae bacterium]